MKRAFILAAIFLTSTQLFAGGTWNKSLAAAKAEATKNNQLIFVDLFADWCGWCHRMEQEVFPSETFQNATENLVLLKLNTEDKADGTRIAQQFGVRSLPTFLLVAPDGTLAGVINGYSPAPEFVKRMKAEEDGYFEFTKLVANEKQLGKDYEKRMQLAEEFLHRGALHDAESRLLALVAESDLPSNLRDDAFYNLALAEAMQKKYDLATKTVKRFLALQSKGDSAEKSQILLGQMLVEQGNLKAALAEYKKFKQTYPDSPYVQNVDYIVPQLESAISKAQ